MVRFRRVLHLGKFFWPFYGGMETFLADLVWSQKQAGLEVSVLVHHHVPSLLFAQTCYWKGVPVTRVPTLGRLLFAPISPLFPAYLWRVLKSFKPHIVHVHVPNTSAFWLLLMRKKPPIVLHWHADVLPSQIHRGLRRFHRFYAWFERKLLREARAIVATSPPYLEHSLALQPHRHKTFVVPLGVRLERLKRLKKLAGNIFSSNSYILTVGRHSYYKGHEYFLSAISALCNEYKFKVYAIIVGSGKGTKKLTRLIKYQNLENHVMIFPTIPQEELNFLYKNSAFFCLPSVERTEAFGLCLLEAMFFSKALLTFHVPGSGMSWVNEDKKTGLIVKDFDIYSLAEAIKFLLEDKKLRQFLGKNAYAKLIKQFQIEKVEKQLREIYNKV